MIIIIIIVPLFTSPVLISGHHHHRSYHRQLQIQNNLFPRPQLGHDQNVALNVWTLSTNLMGKEPNTPGTGRKVVVALSLSLSLSNFTYVAWVASWWIQRDDDNDQEDDVDVVVVIGIL